MTNEEFLAFNYDLSFCSLMTSGRVKGENTSHYSEEPIKFTFITTNGIKISLVDKFRYVYEEDTSTIIGLESISSAYIPISSILLILEAEEAVEDEITSEPIITQNSQKNSSINPFSSII